MATSLQVAGRGCLERSIKTCRSSLRVSLSMNSRKGSMPRWRAVFWSIVLFRYGCKASVLALVKTGDITKSVRKRARPMMTWLGGRFGMPIALRRSDSTTMIRVKLVASMRMAGTSDRIVTAMSNWIESAIWPLPLAA